jgi:CP family cyanate transporter-like MFS transporter
VAIVLITINLRLALGSVPPVLDDMRETLGMSTAGAGVLTTVPVLCFGLAAPLAARLARRFGQEALVLAALVAVAIGIALRIAPSLVPVFLGTIVLGAGIAVANVLLPSIIKRRYADPGLMMGLFTASLSISGAMSAAFTVPLEEALGSWRWALAFWVLPIIPAIALWAPDVRRSGSGPTVGSNETVGLRHDRIAWLVTGSFGLQSLLFYTHMSWVPDIFRDAGLTSANAGAMLSISMLVGVPCSLALPIFASRLRDQRLLGVLPATAWALGLAGLLVDPGGLSWLWMALTGVGQGTGVALTLMLVVLRAPDGTSAAALSGMAQGIGYLLAAAGPVAVGALHDLTGGWEWPVALLLVMCACMLACCVGAGRDRFVRGIPPSGGSSAPVL